LASAALRDFRRCTERDADDAIAVADDQVAGFDHHPFDCNRHVDFTWAVLVGPAMGDAGCEDRKVAGMQRIEVAYRAVDHDPADAAGFCVRHHHFADQGIGEIAAAVNYDDIAGLGDVEGFVDHEIVAGPGFDREGGTCERAAAVHRPKRCASRRHPRHRIADIGNRQLAKFCDGCRIHLAFAFADLESNHGYPLFSHPLSKSPRRLEA